MASFYKQAMMPVVGFILGGLIAGYWVKMVHCRNIPCRAPYENLPQEAIVSEDSEASHVNLDRAFGKENVVDVVIIGSGPAGLSAGLYTSRFARKTLIIDGNNQGGQLMGTSHVENWPGIPKILGPDLIAQLREQAASFGPSFLADAIERVDFSSWPYKIYTENSIVLHALSVIIATGASPRKLGIPGEQEYWGRGVTTCAICDAPFYKEADVVVVGGGDSAVEEAIQLTPYAKNITMLVRRDVMAATPIMQARIPSYPNITVRYNTSITDIIGDGVHVTGLELIDNVTKERSSLPIQGVFLAIGHIPNTQLFKDSVKLNQDGYILMQGRSQMASIPGIFAAGDVEDDVYRQGGVAAGNGIKAAIDADRFLASLGLDKQAQQKLAQQYFVVDAQEDVQLAELETLQQYEDALSESSLPVILDFYTDSCSSCLQMLPVLSSVAQEFTDQVQVFKVNAETAIELVEKFLVYKVPCLIVIKDGKIVVRYNEAMSKKGLTELIEGII